MNAFTQAPPESIAIPPLPDPAPGLPAYARRGLVVWLFVLLGGGLVLLLTEQADGAVLLAIAGQFLAARVADHDEGWSLFNGLVQFLIPALGAAAFSGLAWLSWRAEVPDAARVFAAAWCATAAVVSLLLFSRPFTNAVAALCFRTVAPNRVLRLSARIMVLGMLLPIPALVLSGRLLEAITSMGDSIASPSRLVGSLVGEIVLALAAVGFLIDRDLRRTLERLGVGAIGLREISVAAIGLGAAVALTSALEVTQRQLFPGTWRFDQEVVNAIAGHLPLATTLLLGVSAGVGEELAVRGALQPRLGIVLSSLLFAALHVQYSWYGMLSVGLLGALLGLIRARTNTSTAMLVHAAYDVVAALGQTGS